MEPRNVLIYLSMKYDGEYDAIYNAIASKEDVDLPNDFVPPSNAITFLDEQYPEYLKMMFKPPLVIYCKGDISLISDAKHNLAVIGTRHPTLYGETVTKDLISHLPNNVNIVSGFAYGIDTIAHETAISSGHKTIAILPCGINYCYPSKNKELMEKVAKDHLIISEYPKDIAPKPTNFLMRNRLIAFLSKAVLVTDAYARSGTSITVQWALCANIDVCAVPSNIYRRSFCNELLWQGAHPVCRSQDILDVMGLHIDEPLFEK